MNVSVKAVRNYTLELSGDAYDLVVQSLNEFVLSKKKLGEKMVKSRDEVSRDAGESHIETATKANDLLTSIVRAR